MKRAPAFAGAPGDRGLAALHLPSLFIVATSRIKSIRTEGGGLEPHAFLRKHLSLGRWRSHLATSPSVLPRTKQVSCQYRLPREDHEGTRRRVTLRNVTLLYVT